MSIDTLGFSKYLEEHGVPRPVAEAHAEAANRFLFPQLVTKQDLDQRATELRAAIIETRLWAIGSQIAIAGLALAVAKAVF